MCPTCRTPNEGQHVACIVCGANLDGAKRVSIAPFPGRLRTYVRKYSMYVLASRRAASTHAVCNFVNRISLFQIFVQKAQNFLKTFFRFFFSRPLPVRALVGCYLLGLCHFIGRNKATAEGDDARRRRRQERNQTEVCWMQICKPEQRQVLQQLRQASTYCTCTAVGMSFVVKPAKTGTGQLVLISRLLGNMYAYRICVPILVRTVVFRSSVCVLVEYVLGLRRTLRQAMPFQMVTRCPN